MRCRTEPRAFIFFFRQNKNFGNNPSQNLPRQDLFTSAAMREPAAKKRASHCFLSWGLISLLFFQAAPELRAEPPPVKIYTSSHGQKSRKTGWARWQN
jgi:hypothetical protein